MSVAPSPIITTFLKWNCSFRWAITFPFPPDSAVGCVSSNPAYSPRKQQKDKLEIQIFSCKLRKISTRGLDSIASSPVKPTAWAPQINNSKVSLRLGVHPSLQWGGFSMKNRNIFREKEKPVCAVLPMHCQPLCCELPNSSSQGDAETLQETLSKEQPQPLQLCWATPENPEQLCCTAPKPLQGLREQLRSRTL